MSPSLRVYLRPPPLPLLPTQETWTWRIEWVLQQQEGPCRRDMATLTHVGGGRLLLFGGRNEAGRVVNDAWIYEPDR